MLFGAGVGLFRSGSANTRVALIRSAMATASEDVDLPFSRMVICSTSFAVLKTSGYSFREI